MKSAGRACIWEEMGIRTEHWDSATFRYQRGDELAKEAEKAKQEGKSEEIVVQVLIEQSFLRRRKWSTMIISTDSQRKIIKVILRNMQVVTNSDTNNFHQVLVKIACLAWVEKEMTSEYLVIEALKDIIKWFYCKELPKMKWYLKERQVNRSVFLFVFRFVVFKLFKYLIKHFYLVMENIQGKEEKWSLRGNSGQLLREFLEKTKKRGDSDQTGFGPLIGAEILSTDAGRLINLVVRLGEITANCSDFLNEVGGMIIRIENC